jgi:hypothetical protein
VDGYSKKDGMFIHRNTIKKTSKEIKYGLWIGCKEEMVESDERTTLKQRVQEHNK